jgi:GNAT superfamily N-acetyltransferase
MVRHALVWNVMSDLIIRPATSKDCALMLALLRELAAYEKLLDQFRTSEAILARDFFGPQPAVFCDLAFADGEAVGIATYYWTYGSFSTARGLFVEDLFVRPAFRGRGHGKTLLKHLAGKGADRLDWWVLDWNISAIEFYKSIGARPIQEWSAYRLEGEAMKALAG